MCQAPCQMLEIQQWIMWGSNFNNSSSRVSFVWLIWCPGFQKSTKKTKNQKGTRNKTVHRSYRSLEEFSTFSLHRNYTKIPPCPVFANTPTESSWSTGSSSSAVPGGAARSICIKMKIAFPFRDEQSSVCMSSENTQSQNYRYMDSQLAALINCECESSANIRLNWPVVNNSSERATERWRVSHLWAKRKEEKKMAQQRPLQDSHEKRRSQCISLKPVMILWEETSYGQ